MSEQDPSNILYSAIRAVADLHSSTSILLKDCDKLFKNKKSVFGNNVTRDLSYTIDTPMWMSEGVYRYWKLGEGHIAGFATVFCEKGEDSGKFDKPLAVFGQLQYLKSETGWAECDCWDLWHIGLHREAQNAGTGQLPASSQNLPEKLQGRIATVDYVVMPLIELSNIQNVVTQFAKCGIEVKPDS